jgi:hypothetical protein
LTSNLAATFAIIHGHISSVMRRIGRNPETATVCCRLLFSDNSKAPERPGPDPACIDVAHTRRLVVPVDLRFLQEVPPGAIFGSPGDHFAGPETTAASAGHTGRWRAPMCPVHPGVRESQNLTRAAPHSARTGRTPESTIDGSPKLPSKHRSTRFTLRFARSHASFPGSMRCPNPSAARV